MSNLVWKVVQRAYDQSVADFLRTERRARAAGIPVKRWEVNG